MHLLADSARSDMTARARRNERGAVLIEAVFVFPVLIVLTMGILEFGLAFGSSATTTASTRSGARLAAASYAPAATTLAGKQAVGDQVAAAVTADLKALSNATPVGMVLYKVDSTQTDGEPIGGFPSDTMSGCSTECLKYTWSSSTKQMVYSSGSWLDPDACGTTVDSVGVYVITNHHFVTGLFGSGKFLHGKTVMRLEPLPSDSC
jgi:hypothetical protein